MVLALTIYNMLKHHETIVGLLKSINSSLVTLNEAVQLLLPHPMQKAPMAAPAEKLEPLLNKEQVMDYLDIKETAYYRWVKDGKLTPRGGKGQHKYYPNDIKKLMEQRKYRKRG